MCEHCDPWLSESVRAIIDAALAEEFEVHHGPGHVVFSDDNVEDEFVDSCIRQCDDPRPQHSHMDEATWKRVCEVTRRHALKLKAIPEAERFIPAPPHD